MSQPESQSKDAPRYRHYVSLLGLIAFVALTLGALLAKTSGFSGLRPGQHAPPFAVPLAAASLEGDANIATHSHEGQAGAKPACTVRGAQILNICELYEHHPVVLALFVDGGDCTKILDELQALARSMPSVRFAAVAIRGQRASLRALVAKRRLTIPVGYDRDGALAGLYRLASCPQVDFIYPGGALQSVPPALTPPLAQLRMHASELLAGSAASQHAPASSHTGAAKAPPRGRARGG
ncbi:MAG TPA: hypothetical protein VIC05_00350 [Solirubrobacteraceae bacterium]|jgi:hypothetical protein